MLLTNITLLTTLVEPRHVVSFKDSATLYNCYQGLPFRYCYRRIGHICSDDSVDEEATAFEYTSSYTSIRQYIMLPVRVQLARPRKSVHYTSNTPTAMPRRATGLSCPFSIALFVDKWEL